MTTYTIPAYRLDAFLARVTVAGNVARKCGLASEIVARVVSRDYRGMGGGDDTLVVEVDGMPCGPVALPGGWRFCGVVERGIVGEDGTPHHIVRGVPGVDLGAYRCHGMTCDHCGANRQRSKVVIVESADGVRKSIGTACVRDYLGTDLGPILEWSTVSLAVGDDEGMGGGGKWVADLGTYAAAACASVRACGWVSRSKAMPGQTPTVDDACAMVAILGNPRAPEADKARVAEALEACAGVAREIMATLPPVDTEGLSDFDHSAAVIGSMGYCESKHLPLWVAWVGVALARREAEAIKAKREAEKAAKCADLAPASHVGTEGGKWAGEVTIERVHPLAPNAYGERCMVLFRVAGTLSSLVWFTSPDAAAKVGSVGDAVKVAASVKAHKVGKYGPETIVQRVKAEPLPA